MSAAMMCARIRPYPRPWPGPRRRDRRAPALGLTFVIVLLAVLVGPRAAGASEPEDAAASEPVAVQAVETAPSSAPRVALEIPPGAAMAGATGGDFDVARATDAYLGLIGPEVRARSNAYFEGGYWLTLVGFLYGLGVAWLLLGTRLSARMRALGERITRRRGLQTALYALQYTVVTAALTFPLTVYRDFVREHDYGLSTQGFGAWFGEQLTALLVSAILGAVALVVIYAVIRRFPRGWWLGGSVAGVMLLLLTVMIAPVWIAPLFNDYEPLEAGPVRSSILAMAHEHGVPADDVYRVDASRQSTRISANVSGLFGTTRISLNDNLLERSSQAEIEAVMGHELGHYVLHHVWVAVGLMGLVLVVGMASTQWGMTRLLRRHGERWGIRDVADPAGFPLLVAILSVYFFVLTPVTNSIIRMSEAEADRFGLDVARQPDGFARVAVRLAEYRKLDPGWLEEIVFYDHPSGRARVERAMRWKAEHGPGGGATATTAPAPAPASAPAPE
ncbi:M48 family metallopeptidase [Haliangium sp.]|uniref:M48 family metallopeptidase n=1 Tax=Haliangium sp. TaxID=2663208 RepID=UPI003D0D3750